MLLWSVGPLIRGGIHYIVQAMPSRPQQGSCAQNGIYPRAAVTIPDRETLHPPYLGTLPYTDAQATDYSGLLLRNVN